MAAPPPPSRFAELVDMLRTEYDRVSSENQGYKDIRREWNRKIEEQAAELNTMLSEFRDLERKHTIVKEQYDNEILRLKGQPPNPQSIAAGIPPGVPPPSSQLPIPKRPGPPNSTAPPYSPTMQAPPPPPGDQSHPSHALPTMFSPRPLPQTSHHPPPPHVQQPGMPPNGPLSHHGGVATGIGGGPSASQPPSSQQLNNGGMTAAITSPSSQQQPPSQLGGSAGGRLSLPQAHLGAGRATTTTIPPMATSGPNGLSVPTRSTAGSNGSASGGLLGKMSSITLMPPNGPGTGAGGNSNLFKKDVVMSASPPPNPMMSGGVGGVAPFGAPGRLSGVIGGGGGGIGGPGQHAGVPGMAPTIGEDWAVYQGRAANGSLVNMKVSLQNSLSLDSVVCCVRYSWDGEFLATGSNRAAHIFNAATGQLTATFSKDSSPGSDRDDYSATTTNLNNNGVNGTGVNGGGPLNGGGGTDSYVRAVCFSPDGQWLITGAEDHVVKVWDVNTRKVKHLLRGHGTDIYSVDASPNGKFIISGSGDKRAKLWSLETGELLNTLGNEEHEHQGPTDGITSVSVSPSNLHVAAGSLDKIVRVWDVETGSLVRQFEGHRDSVYSVAFSPDGRLLLSGSLDKTLKLWDLAAPPEGSNQCRLTFTGHKDFVLSVAFSSNGKWLISGSKDRLVQFWDPRQSDMCLMLHGHKNSVISIAHNPATKALATGSGDCRARTWVYS